MNRNKYFKLSFYLIILSYLIVGVFANEFTGLISDFTQGFFDLFSTKKDTSTPLFFTLFIGSTFFGIGIILKSILGNFEFSKKFSGAGGYLIAVIIVASFFIDTSGSIRSQSDVLELYKGFGGFIFSTLVSIPLLFFTISRFNSMREEKSNWDLFTLSFGLLIFSNLMRGFFLKTGEGKDAIEGFIYGIAPDLDIVGTILTYIFWFSFIGIFFGILKGFGGFFTKDPGKDTVDFAKKKTNQIKELVNIISLLKKDVDTLIKVRNLIGERNPSKIKRSFTTIGALRDQIEIKVKEIVNVESGLLIDKTFGDFFKNGKVKAQEIKANQHVISKLIEQIKSEIKDLDSKTSFEAKDCENLYTYINQLGGILTKKIEFDESFEEYSKKQMNASEDSTNVAENGTIKNSLSEEDKKNIIRYIDNNIQKINQENQFDEVKKRLELLIRNNNLDELKRLYDRFNQHQDFKNRSLILLVERIWENKVKPNL